MHLWGTLRFVHEAQIVPWTIWELINFIKTNMQEDLICKRYNQIVN